MLDVESPPSVAPHSVLADPALQAASRRLDTWIEREGFRGWDPHDALNSPLLKRLTFSSRRLGIAWVQLLKRCPFNLRPLFGIPKRHNPKAMGLFLASYLRKYQLSADPAHLALARYFADWLREHATPGYRGACWGYHFDWPNRHFYAPAGTPTVVNTAFIGLALLDLYRHGAQDPLRCPDYALQALDLARSACDFLLRDLNLLRPSSGQLCFSYTPLDRRLVHNANLLGAWLLAEVFRSTGESHLQAAALAAARYTASRQRPPGFWPYGEAPHDAWVDNFHSGFVLVALNHVAACLHTGEFRQVLERGYDFWKRSFFRADGAPAYYPDKPYPIDAHSVAQAILTFLDFTADDPEALACAWKTARFGLARMQAPEGWFHYQIHRGYRIRVPFMRWSQAWMQRALAELALRPAVAP